MRSSAVYALNFALALRQTLPSGRLTKNPNEVAFALAQLLFPADHEYANSIKKRATSRAAIDYSRSE